MDESKAGPSAVKKRKVGKQVQQTVRDRYPLSEEQLFQYLMDSDYSDSYSNSGSESEDSDFEQEVDISAYAHDDFDNVSSDIPSPRSQTPPPPVIWDSEDDIVTVIPFSKQRELLIQPKGNTPMDFFNLLVTDGFLQLIVRETNIHAEELFLESTTKEKSRITWWNEVTLEELKVFIGLLFHMGSIKLNRLQDYWKEHRLFKIPVFKEYLSRDRFMAILRCLHFVSNPLPGQESPEDRLYEIRPIIDYFNSRMNDVYCPGKELSLDESMVLWRGRLGFRQYIENKRHKYGLKLYLLSEPDGIVLKFAVYTGTLDNFGGRGHAANVVLHLMNGKLDVGHSLYMDNYFNSYELASKLLSRKTYCTGTIRMDRKSNPVDVKVAKLKKGETIARYANGVMVAKWKDVFYISTEFRNNLINYFNTRQQEKTKPEAILKYNTFMGGVDGNDQLMAFYPCERKTMPWYKKIGIHIIYMCLMNSFFLYKKFVRSRISLYDFRLEVLEHLLPKKADSHIEKRIPIAHIPVKNPQSGQLRKHARRRCKVCYQNKIRTETVFHCPACPKTPALCVEPCFTIFHQDMVKYC